MSPKLGQKLTDNPKDSVIRARVDSETVKKLDYLVKENGSNRSEVIRKGINIQYEEKNKIERCPTTN